MRHARVVMSDEAYERLLKTSMENGYVTIADYLMALAGLPNDSKVADLLKELISGIDQMKRDTDFQVKDLIPRARWDLYDTGTHIIASRMFSERVEAKLFSGLVRISVMRNTAIPYYRKIAND